MSKSKRIGTTFERQVADYLTGRGIPCRRVALAGRDDEGDVRDDAHRFVLECKGGKAAESASHGQITTWLEETERERRAAEVSYGFLVTKTAGKGAAQAGLWRVHVPARELRMVWGAMVPATGFTSVTLETFADWWLDAHPF